MPGGTPPGLVSDRTPGNFGGVPGGTPSIKGVSGTSSARLISRRLEGVPTGTPSDSQGFSGTLSVYLDYGRRDAAAPHDVGWFRGEVAGNPRNPGGMAR